MTTTSSILQFINPSSTENSFMSVISPEIIFLVLALVPLLIAIPTISLEKEFFDFFHTKILYIKRCFFIMISIFVISILIVWLRIDSSVPLFNSKSFIFKPEFLMGTIALVAFLTLAAIRTKKYTAFEHSFVLTYSLLSLYLFYFSVSKFGITQWSLYLLIFIFLINVGIFITFKKYVQSIGDNQLRSTTLYLYHYHIRTFLQTRKTFKKFDIESHFYNSFTDKTKKNLLADSTSLKPEIDFDKFLFDFEYSFSYFLIKNRFYFINTKLEWEISADNFISSKLPIFNEFIKDVNVRIEQFFQSILEKSLSSYETEYNGLLKKFSIVDMSNYVVTPEMLKEKIQNLNTFYLNQFPNYIPEVENVQKFHFSFFKALDILLLNLKPINDVYESINEVSNQMRNIRNTHSDIEISLPYFPPAYVQNLVKKGTSLPAKYQNRS